MDRITPEHMTDGELRAFWGTPTVINGSRLEEPSDVLYLVFPVPGDDASAAEIIKLGHTHGVVDPYESGGIVFALQTDFRAYCIVGREEYEAASLIEVMRNTTRDLASAVGFDLPCDSGGLVCDGCSDDGTRYGCPICKRTVDEPEPETETAAPRLPASDLDQHVEGIIRLAQARGEAVGMASVLAQRLHAITSTAVPPLGGVVEYCRVMQSIAIVATECADRLVEYVEAHR